MNNSRGRPTKYREDMPEGLDKYLQTTGTARKSLPTMQGFSLWLDVDDETLAEWAKKYPDFSATLKRLMKLQAKQLMDDGVYNKDANSTIIKLLLQNNHGMKERTDNTTNDKDLPTPLLSGVTDVSSNNGSKEAK